MMRTMIMPLAKPDTMGDPESSVVEIPGTLKTVTLYVDGKPVHEEKTLTTNWPISDEAAAEAMK